VMLGRLAAASVLAAPGAAVAAVAAPAGAAAAAPPNAPGHCGSGPRTLSHHGDHVYPDTGNGGYTSLHTDINMIYDAPSNQFLPGNHVVLTLRATQCLTDFSLDFERRGADAHGGPDTTADSAPLPARRAYPGAPNAPDAPDPRAHQASQANPVGGPQNNPLPPACSPQVTGDDVNAQNGEQCPANKLVITPKNEIPNNAVFKVTVFYT